MDYNVEIDRANEIEQYKVEEKVSEILKRLGIEYTTDDRNFLNKQMKDKEITGVTKAYSNDPLKKLIEISVKGEKYASFIVETRNNNGRINIYTSDVRYS